jgi:hypothetical protein
LDTNQQPTLAHQHRYTNVGKYDGHYSKTIELRGSPYSYLSLCNAAPTTFSLVTLLKSSRDVDVKSGLHPVD